MDLSIRTDKERLRRDARERRRDFVAGLDAASRSALEAAIAARIAGWIAGKAVIASYCPMGHEVDPAACLGALPPGARIALPWFKSRNAGMRFRLAGGRLEPGPFGTMQPAADAPFVDPDVLLVPLVAADVRGNRIGQGKGHFDRTIAALRASGFVVAIGLAWDTQIFDTLPADAWDQRLDAVITPTRVLSA